MRPAAALMWLGVAILSNCLIGSYMVLARQVELKLAVPVPPLRAITLLKSVSTVAFLLFCSLPDLVALIWRRTRQAHYPKSLTADTEQQLLDDASTVAPRVSRLQRQVAWTAVIIVAAFLRITSETVAPYFTPAYRVVFIQMWAPLLIALLGRLGFGAALPKGFGTCLGLLAGASGLTLLGAAAPWNREGPGLTWRDALGMGFALLAVLSIVIILYAVARGKQVLGDRFILFLVMASMLLFTPWLTLLEPGSYADLRALTPGDWGWVAALGLNNFFMIFCQNQALYNLGPPLVSVFIPLRLAVATLGSASLLREPLGNWVEALGLGLVFCIVAVYLCWQYWQALLAAEELAALEQEHLARFGSPRSYSQRSSLDVLAQ